MVSAKLVSNRYILARAFSALFPRHNTICETRNVEISDLWDKRCRNPETPNGTNSSFSFIHSQFTGCNTYVFVKLINLHVYTAPQLSEGHFQWPLLGSEIDISTSLVDLDATKCFIIQNNKKLFDNEYSTPSFDVHKALWSFRNVETRKDNPSHYKNE